MCGYKNDYVRKHDNIYLISYFLTYSTTKAKNRWDSQRKRRRPGGWASRRARKGRGRGRGKGRGRGRSRGVAKSRGKPIVEDLPFT